MSLPIKKRPLFFKQDHDHQDPIDVMPERHDQNPVDVMPEQEGHDQNLVDVMPSTSQSTEEDKQEELQGRSANAGVLPLPPSNWSTRSQRSLRAHRVIGWLGDVFLFAKQVEPKDIERSRLAVPWAIAEHYFLPHRQPYLPTQIRISNTLHYHWHMTVSFSPRNREYLIKQGWLAFSAAHNLEAMDVVRFYRPKYRLEVYHYLVKIVKANKTKGDVTQSGKQKHHGNEDYSKKHSGHGGNQEPAPVQWN